MDEKERDLFFQWARPYECDYLYKYRSFSSKGLAEIFERNEIYFSCPTQFNDPFDCNPNVVIHRNRDKFRKWMRRVIKEREPTWDKYKINQLLNNSDNVRRFKSKSFQRDLFKNFTSGLGVLSLSEKCNDILMWSHYSDSHKGICIEFDSKDETSVFWENYKVKYEEEYPTVNVMELEHIEEWLKTFTVKALHWEYEAERRILKTQDKGGPGNYKFRPEQLKSVILGACISDENKEKVHEWVQDYPASIQIKQAKLNENYFKVDIVDE
jgi:hypothetical protein